MRFGSLCGFGSSSASSDSSVQNGGSSDSPAHNAILSVPVGIVDRYFLGGPCSLRGFSTRGIGPRCEGDLVAWLNCFFRFVSLILVVMNVQVLIQSN